MDFWEVIKKRKCIRKYQDKKIPGKDILKILEAGILAPSEGNIQPWFFYVVKNRSKRKELEKAGMWQEFLSEAPVTIVICINLDQIKIKYGKRGLDLYHKQSTAAATENMFLAATALGLGACWVGGFFEKEISKILSLPKNLRPVVLMPIGYPAEKGRLRGRKPIEEVSKFVE